MHDENLGCCHRRVSYEASTTRRRVSVVCAEHLPDRQAVRKSQDGPLGASGHGKVCVFLAKATPPAVAPVKQPGTGWRFGEQFVVAAMQRSEAVICMIREYALRSRTGALLQTQRLRLSAFHLIDTGLIFGLLGIAGH